MSQHDYFMEADEETLRLEIKTDEAAVEKQAVWAGIKPAMRVADLGCGPGKTTRCLNRLAQPGGETLGVDLIAGRIEYAKSNYASEGIHYVQADIRDDLQAMGMFDFIWVRFVLEYYRQESFDIVRNILKVLKPGGIICLIDLDHNCLCHYGIPERLVKAYTKIIDDLVEEANFDPFVGRKLYSYLYDLGCCDIDVNMFPHHLIFGPLKEADEFNWTRKVKGAVKKTGYTFKEYGGRADAFYDEFISAFSDPRRFTYTPVICCRGRKPVA